MPALLRNLPSYGALGVTCIVATVSSPASASDSSASAADPQAGASAPPASAPPASAPDASKGPSHPHADPSDPHAVTAEPPAGASHSYAGAYDLRAAASSPHAGASDPPTAPSSSAAFSCHLDGSPCEHRMQFSADPVSDGALLAGSIGFAGLSEAILSTGEIRPQQIDATFDTKRLLPLDRNSLEQDVDHSASTLSNVGMYVTLGYGLFDTVASGFREERNAAIVDAVIYSEAIAFSWGLTNLAKIGFRRPRPIAYIERQRAIDSGQDPTTYSNTSTDSALSFYSGHTAIASTVWATATYLAFARSPHTARPWVTLAAGLLMTSFIGVERVRAREHFPSDVIAGGLAGMGVGVLVAHLHRHHAETRSPMWVGGLPVQGGGIVSVGGRF